jgi:uncharacterized protein (DUF1330 family)
VAEEADRTWKVAVEPQANMAMARWDPMVDRQPDDSRHTNGGPVSITPNPDQFLDYVNSDLDGEVVMVNLLKFKSSAESGDGSGADAYSRYGDAVTKMIENQGGTVVWLGKARHVFIGDPQADGWDAVALVSYPNRQAFIDMVSTPAYNEAHTDREDGLERTVVIACTPTALTAKG